MCRVSTTENQVRPRLPLPSLRQSKSRTVSQKPPNLPVSANVTKSLSVWPSREWREERVSVSNGCPTTSTDLPIAVLSYLWRSGIRPCRRLQKLNCAGTEGTHRSSGIRSEGDLAGTSTTAICDLSRTAQRPHACRVQRACWTIDYVSQLRETDCGRFTGGLSLLWPGQ